MGSPICIWKQTEEKEGGHSVKMVKLEHVVFALASLQNLNRSDRAGQNNQLSLFGGILLVIFHLELTVVSPSASF